ncbi:serine/threonine-protein phosphatase 2A regulatory subunit B'' subunit beta isoform X1 [Takifugu flavidus]|uniref:serine/threonine-protein phosphatase 2A regulatory subunit B'' subunit beta isoform X1 n=1 Tax=Takifugu flavidus TaxID=433684 RepID=UPI000E6F3EAB|nr:serine/threonine-protein phosphatase 2A regulatory subunit B'' subunit beta isoform X1 [Takifugu flavidus]XP_056902850.1 serine/threonine-protein phosphatase 2A regulatory subunit B'' subunit beta isoform X1 [Takifugu flavidus]XP_056902859.1 serine/threonine-protein phosphatase 2A regulatory subunit B'' subunit beta isoform X1 [Takifugu flavidus]
MPSSYLQPVLKMKVDELFFTWLSDPSTQSSLKEYLDLIKSGQRVDLDEGDAPDKKSLTFNENNNVASQRNLAEERPFSSSTLSNPSPTSALPSGSSCNARMTGPNGRVLRKSISTRKAKLRTEEPVTTVLSESIPKFHFPQGRPQANLNIDSLISKIEKIFSQFPNERATIEEMGQVAKACECSLYWKMPLFCLAGGDRTGFVSVHKFVAMWRKTLQTCHDEASKFVHLLAKPGCNYLEQDDFIPFLQDVVNSHPGLAFLKEAPDFHSRYITTVIQRVFYNVNRSWSGKITCSELRKSNFLQNVALLEQEEDVNQLTEFFSYEHFYVIYCKFWELDTDHDLYIDQRDLAQHNDQAISQKMIERIFSGTVTRDRRVHKEGRLSYADFVWFLISEEDKKTDTSVEYWFRCMDLDGDGVLSMYELEFFYEEQCQKLEAMAIEPLPFEDCLCQMLDLVKPEFEGKITLRDLKRCKLSHIFFDTFFNIEKYLEHEQKDPFSVIRELETDGQEVSDWEKYAAEEYDILVAEEAANEECNDVNSAKSRWSWTQSRYENDLIPLTQHNSNELGLMKRHFFDFPSPGCNLNLQEYDYEDDFE